MTVPKLLDSIRIEGWEQELPPKHNETFTKKDYGETFIKKIYGKTYRLVILIDEVKPE